MPNTGFVDMKRTKADIKKESRPTPIGEGDKYPYGLEVRLNKDSLNKLGIDVSKYKVGEKIQIIAQANIEDLRKSENINI